MITSGISWVKGGRCVRLTTLPPSCVVVTKSGSLNFLEPSGPVQACNGIALPFTFLPNNASRWQMGFNSAFKGLILVVLTGREREEVCIQKWPFLGDSLWAEPLRNARKFCGYASPPPPPTITFGSIPFKNMVHHFRLFSDIQYCRSKFLTVIKTTHCTKCRSFRRRFAELFEFRRTQFEKHWIERSRAVRLPHPRVVHKQHTLLK